MYLILFLPVSQKYAMDPHAWFCFFSTGTVNHFHHHLRMVKEVKSFLIYTVYNTQTLLRYCLFNVSNEAGIANLEIVFSRCQFSIFSCVLHKAKNYYGIVCLMFQTKLVSQT